MSNEELLLVLQGMSITDKLVIIGHFEFCTTNNTKDKVLHVLKSNIPNQDANLLYNMIHNDVILCERIFV